MSREGRSHGCAERWFQSCITIVTVNNVAARLVYATTVVFRTKLVSQPKMRIYSKRIKAAVAPFKKTCVKAVILVVFYLRKHPPRMLRSESASGSRLEMSVPATRFRIYRDLQFNKCIY